MKKKNDAKGFERVRLFLALFVLLSGFAAPMPAHAGAFDVIDAERIRLIKEKWDQRLKFWSQTHRIMWNILQEVTDITNDFVNYMSELDQRINLAATSRTSDFHGLSKAEEKLQDQKSSDRTQDRLLELAAEASMQDVPPRHQQLCNAIVVNKAGIASDSFRESVATFASTAAETMYRGPNDDGGGPQYARDMLQSEADMKLMEKIDGVSSSLIDSTTKGTDQRRLSGAHLSATTLDGGQVLELPPVTNETKDGVTYKHPDPQNDEQKFWVAGFYYCLGVVGPRPTPPNKKEIETPDGMVKRAQWEHCATIGSAMARGCMEMLAFYTRPNNSMAELIKTNKQTYAAVKKFGVKLEDDPRYANGEKGLSPYLEANAVNLICKSGEFYVAQSSAGAKHGDMMATVSKCTAAWSAWNSMNDKMKANLVKAGALSEKLKQCWASTGR